jgi:hypothetical protein
LSKDETQKIASATALAVVALLEEKGMLRDTAQSVIEKTENALRQYPVWRTMNDPDAQRKVAEIDACLEAAANDPYVDTIRLFYFGGLTNAATAKTICCDYRTAQRNRRELVKQFAARLYPKEYMQEML